MSYRYITKITVRIVDLKRETYCTLYKCTYNRNVCTYDFANEQTHNVQ